MATSPKGDKVSFVSVQKSYPPGENLDVTYSLHSDLKSATRDWVGLFRVGWSSSRDYYTFEWAPTPNENKGVITFAGKRLPPEDRHFYQFCYVSSDGRVRGASPPFQFSSVAAPENIDDLELVEVLEDSLMILQPKETKENEAVGISGLELELVSIKESVSKLEAEKESLLGKYEVVEQGSNTKSERLTELEEKVIDLEKQLQAKRESETRLMEKLEKERALNHELATTKSNDESELALIGQQLNEQEDMVTTLKKENEAIQLEVKELKRQKEALRLEVKDSMLLNEELCAKCEETNKKLNQLQEVEVDMMTQIGEKTRDCDVLRSMNEELQVQLGEEIAAITKEKDQVLQELSIAQQNIAELLGAKKEGVVVNIHSNQEPPTLPAAQVDRSAYEALQQASEEIENLLEKANKDIKYLNSQANAYQMRNAELVRRVGICREEYGMKSKELHDLQQMQHQSGGSNISTLQVKIQEMEENQEQVTRSWEEAIQELASRKEEIKTKDINIAELENEIASVKQEFENFQDKHDQVLQGKVEKMDEQQAYLDEKVLQLTELHARVAGLTKENGKLTHTIQQLREQLATLKTKAKSPERSCPVCSTKFPGRISQEDYERHVEGHFQQELN